MHHRLCLLSTFLLVPLVFAAPAPSSTSATAKSTTTVRYATNDPNDPLWGPDSNVTPEPMRGATGGKVLGPQNIPMDLENPDALASSSTDNGDV